MAYYKKLAKSEQDYRDNEFRHNFVASFLGGAIGSGLTNCGEVLTVNKQTKPDIKLGELIQKERWQLFTKGILARVYYNSMQSVLFFSIIMYLGKVYNVDLTE